MDVADIAQNGLNWGNGLSLAVDVASVLIPGIPAVGAAVRALNAVDTVADAAKAVNATTNAVQAANQADNSIDLYRGIKTAEDGLPILGDTGRALGPTPRDIPVGPDGMVRPGTGGMSVSPDSPMNLPLSRRPPEFGGAGKDPVWQISSSDLGTDLTYRPDPDMFGHGFIEPAYPMPFQTYQQAVWDTRPNWTIVTPP